MYAFGFTPVKVWLESNAVGTTMPNLSTAILERLPLPIPPLDEQLQIAERLAAIDRKIAAEETRRSVLEDAF
jgi:type I restriction enzyme S subunit